MKYPRIFMPVMLLESGFAERKSNQEIEYVPLEEFESLKAKLELYEKAMLSDISNAGPLTGSIYHEKIRAVLGFPELGCGSEIMRKEK